MTPFDMLSDFARAMFALWALLLCLINIGSAILSAIRKRYGFTVFALLLFAPSYYLWQVIFDLSLFGSTDKAADITASLCGLPWIDWLCAFLILTLGSAALMAYIIRYDKNYITPGAIKIFLDKMPCGVCCWNDSGRVLFSNVCMNRLCDELTHSPLLNANQLRGAVKDGILTVGGKVWRFAGRDILLDGETLYEMIASDITAEYAKTEALKQDKTELSQMNRELREYYCSIDDAVRRQEILQAKVSIHDEMNRLMLSTAAADSGDADALNRIFSLWEQNALLLCMESSDSKAADSIEKLAGALRIKLVWRDPLPEELTEKQRGLFFCAAQEAIINAVKHAQATTITIGTEETENRLYCLFTNDGNIPSSAVALTGGLANLSLLAENQGAKISVKADGEFTLTLCFPKNK